MKIVVLTYDAPHRKTEDVVWRLMSGGRWGELSVVAVPWKKRKERKYLYAHRPAERHWPCSPSDKPVELYARLGINYSVSKDEHLFNHLGEISPDIVVVGGAGILHESIVKNYHVINVHPGLLPARRGLDVFKWSIIDCKQVGVTAHICDENTDLGWRLFERKVPVYPEDTFHAFAMRQYEYELELFAPSVELLTNNLKSDFRFDKITPGETRAFRRMPVEIEAQLPEAFGRYKRVFCES